jgi:Right handed beta helix region
VTIQDCDIEQCHVGIYCELGPDSFTDQNKFVIVRRCTIHDNGTFTGWLGAGTDVLIEKNTFYRNGLSSGFHHAIYYGGGLASQEYYRAVIRHNHLYDNNVNGGTMSGGHLTWRGRLNYTTIENNLVTNSATQNAPSYALSHAAGYGDPEHHYKTVIRGNRVYNIARAINFGSAPGIVIENNVIVDLTTGNTQAAGGIVGAAPPNSAGDSGDGQAKIRNNSIYIHEQRASAHGIVIEAAAGTGIEIDNNAIVFGPASAGTSYAFSLTETGGVTYASLRNNFLGGSFSGWHSGFTTLASFQSHFDALSGTDCSGNVENATTGLTTPSLGNNLNMVPTSGSSPVVNAALAGLTKLAVSGYAREATRDIGAFEYGRNP